MAPRNTLHAAGKMGSAYFRGDHVFFKRLPLDHYLKELAGYSALQKHYPVPRLLAHFEESRESGLLLFEYEEEIGQDKGLLLDLIASGSPVRPFYNQVTDLVSSVFQETLRQDDGQSAQVFFAERIPTRLADFYPPAFISSVDGTAVSLNGAQYIIRLGEVLAGVRSFFKHLPSSTWCVLSQCDFHDLNIGTKPVLFDFLAGGYNPLMAEFTIPFWYNLAMGSYLAPKYHPEAFTEHPKILSQLDTVTDSKVGIEHQLSDTRREMIERYIDNVITPIVDSKGYDTWYDEFKNYLAMRMLAIFNVSKMEEIDKRLVLGYLMKFYFADIELPSQLKAMLPSQ